MGKKGNYWIATKGTGLIKMTPNGKGGYSYKRYRKGNNYCLNDDNTYCSIEDNEGNIWVATYGGGVNVITKDRNGTEIVVNCNNMMKHYPANEFKKVRCTRTQQDRTRLCD